jgi:quercetin dioxygenase-like cupin family protein
VSVVRKAERRSGGSRKHAYEIITPPLPGQRAEVSAHTLKPAASTGGPGDPPMHEAGSRETAVVTGGTVTLYVAGHEYRLVEGDSVTFDADLPHHFENPDPQEDARFMSVVSAGLRRS